MRLNKNKFLDRAIKRQDIHKMSEKEANRILLDSIIMIVFTLIKSYNLLVIVEIISGVIAYIGVSKYEQSVKTSDRLCILSVIITGVVFTIQILPYIFLNIGW